MPIAGYVEGDSGCRVTWEGIGQDGHLYMPRRRFHLIEERMAWIFRRLRSPPSCHRRHSGRFAVETLSAPEAGSEREAPSGTGPDSLATRGGLAEGCQKSGGRDRPPPSRPPPDSPVAQPLTSA